MTKEQLIDKLVMNYGLSLETASWVDNWIQHFIDEAVKEANKNFILSDVSGSVSSSKMTEQNKELERLRNEGDKRFGSKKHFR